MWSLKKFASAYLFQIEREKSYDYDSIMYHNYAEAKRKRQVQKIIYSNPAGDIVCSVIFTS